MNEIVSGKRDMFTKLGHTHIVTDKLNISALDDITIGTKANHIETIKGNRTENITGDVSETVGGNVTEAITGNLDIDAARIDLN